MISLITSNFNLTNFSLVQLFCTRYAICWFTVYTTLYRGKTRIQRWYNIDVLFQDHIQEVLDKWNQIDDEIWAKVIVFERNRRVAKAYARAPVLTINGSNDGFDGFR